MLSSIDRWTHLVDRISARSDRALAYHDTVYLHTVVEEAMTLSAALIQSVARLEGEVSELKALADEARSNLTKLFETIPIACMTTDDDGVIVAANAAAAALLHVVAKSLCGRRLIHFCDARDRFAGLLHSACAVGDATERLHIRPRERAVMAVDVTVYRHVSATHTQLLWFLRRGPREET